MTIMETYDTFVFIFMSKVSPFLLVILGGFMGFFIGDLLSLYYQHDYFYKITGVLIGLFMGSIIGRGAYNDLN